MVAPQALQDRRCRRGPYVSIITVPGGSVRRVSIRGFESQVANVREYVSSQR